jgi:hypothetical protein
VLTASEAEIVASIAQEQDGDRVLTEPTSAVNIGNVRMKRKALAPNPLSHRAADEVCTVTDSMPH